MFTKTTFEMDGAQCVRSEDGILTFKRKTLLLLLGLIFIGFFELLILGLLAVSLFSFTLSFNYFRGLLILLAIGGFLGYVLFAIVQQLRAPGVQFNTPGRLLIVGQREIPFSQINCLVLPTPEPPARQSSRRANLSATALAAALTTGEIVRLGSLSGQYASLVQRAQQFAQLLNETTGLTVKQQ